MIQPLRRLQRLPRPIQGLQCQQRAEVHALTLELAQRLALRLDAALVSSGSGELAALVMRLFAVTAPNGEDTR